MLAKKDHAAITGSLLLVVVLWGGNFQSQGRTVRRVVEPVVGQF